MKKLLSLLLALMMFAPALSLAEELPTGGDLGIIGGADGPTSVFLASPVRLPGALAEEALAAGRRVSNTLTITELTGVDTGDPTVDAAVKDLINALGLGVAQQGDEFELGLTLSGQDALTFGVAVNGEDCYIKSNLIGGSIVVSADEIEPLVGRLLDMMVTMEAMTADDAESLKEEFALMMETITAELESSMASASALNDLASMNTAALEQMFTFMQGHVEVVKDVAVPRMCDPATEAAMITLTNEEMVVGMKYVYQFLLDNPVLMDYLGAMMSMPTEEEQTLRWKTSGEMYQTYGWYADEAEFREENPTFKQVVETAMAELDGRKVLDGEFTMMVAVNENGEPVWATMSLPVFTQEESVVDAAKTTGKTTQIDVTYTRQTVAQGAAHTCNISVDGEILTIDALVGEERTTISVGGVDAQNNVIRFLDAAVYTALENRLLVDVTVYDGELHEDASEVEAVCQLTLEGECEFTDVRSYFAGTLTVTVPNGEAGEILEAGGSETAVDTTPVETEPSATTMVFELSSDYAINGVDFSGATKISAEVEGVRVGIQLVSETTDPEASIMSGDVTRPAELDDATFANWFVRMYASLSSWLSTVLMALPESVLMLVLSSGF